MDERASLQRCGGAFLNGLSSVITFRNDKTLKSRIYYRMVWQYIFHLCTWHSIIVYILAVLEDRL